MAPSAFHPGEHLDALLDTLLRMGCPAPQWGRVHGEHAVWISVDLPGTHIGTTRYAEHLAPNLDEAAKAVIVCELTPDDGDQDDAAEWIKKRFGAQA
jgi:hypothetical protein